MIEFDSSSIQDSIWDPLFLTDPDLDPTKKPKADPDLDQDSECKGKPKKMIFFTF